VEREVCIRKVCGMEKSHWVLVNECGPCMREIGGHIVDNRPA